MRNVLCAVLLSLPFPLMAASAESAVDAFHEALHAGDKAAALAQLSPDAIIYEQGAAEMTRAQYEAAHLGADVAFSMATKREVLERTEARSGDTAWVLSRTLTTGRWNGKPVRSRGVETMVLRLEGDAWRIVHIHWSSHNVAAK